MKLNSIQALRALAAILVVYEHSMSVQKLYGASFQQNFLHLDHFGCIGVDIFFVISGFIITLISRNYSGANEGVHFLAKRFVRINPIYYLATLIYLSITLLRLYLSDKPAPPLIQTLSSLPDSILIVPTSGNLNNFHTILTVAWTLSFEWFFYFVFFALILSDIKRKPYFLIGTIGLLVLIGQLIKPNDLRLIFITNPIMLEFLLGVIICHLHLKHTQIPLYLGSILIILGTAVLISTLIYGFSHVSNYREVLGASISLKRFIIWGIPSACIVAGCVVCEKNNRLNQLWNNKWFVLCGNASFSIYLIHFAVLDLFSLIPRKARTILPPDLIIWLQLTIAVLTAIAFYKVVEKPLLQYMNNSSLLDFLKFKKQDNSSKLPNTAIITKN